MEIINKENSHKTILNATGIFGFAQVMKMLVSIVGSKFVAIFLGPFGIGIVGLLNNTITIISSITSFGITITGVREISLANAESDQNKFSERFIVLQRWSIFTSFLGAIVTIIFSKQLSKLTFGNSDYYFWFVILSVNFVFANLTATRIALLQGLRMIKSIAISNLISSVLITAVTLPIYYYFKLDGIITVILVSSLINLLVNFYFTRNIKCNNISLSIYETFQKGKPLLKMGFLLSINVIFGQICSYLIKLYLNGNGSSVEIVGLFEVSSVILVSYVGLIFNAMGLDFYPRITEVQNDNSKVRELVNDQIEMGLLLITPAIIFLYFCGPILVKILYSNNFLGVLLIFKAALFAVIVKVVVWPLAFIILAKGDNKLYFKLEIISDIFLLVSTVFLYHLLGLIGIGIASLIQFLLYAFYVIPLLKNKYNFSIRKDTLKILLVCFLIGISASTITFTIDYPYAYYPLGLILVYSIFYSYKELNKRVDIFSYLIKIKNKFKRNE
jgi:O-antigen/teichoic acid export membrane protein